MTTRRRKKAPALNHLRLYAWREDRKASRDCIKHFVRAALAEKLRAATRTNETLATFGDLSIKMHNDTLSRSIHELARGSLEYCRMRASLSSEGGSYAPKGWPLDAPMRRKWERLNQKRH